MSTYATSIPQSYKVMGSGVLPDGEAFIEVNCPNYDAFTALPGGMKYEGETYGLTGWNSDTCLAYYKAGKQFAMTVPVALTRRRYTPNENSTRA